MLKMLPHVKKGLIAAVVLVAATAQNAFAAITAAQVDMSSASADVTTVVLAIIGLLVVIFGFKAILGILRGR